MKFKQNINIDDVCLTNFKRTYEYFKAVNWILDIAIEKCVIDTLLKDEKQKFKNKISVINEVNFKGITLIKKSQSKTNIKSLTHEMFIGKVLNNYIDLPNFVYLFNIYEQGETLNLLQQNIGGF